jgi:hypothetical protein
MNRYNRAIRRGTVSAVDRNQLDSQSELGKAESNRLSAAMDRMSSMTELLSLVLQKLAGTGDAIVQNMK